jgi:hypothetical protein
VIPGIVASGMVSGAAAPADPAGDDWEVLAHLATPVDGLFDFAGLDFTGYQRINVCVDDVVVDTDDTEVWLHLYLDNALTIEDYTWRLISADSAGSSNDVTPSLGTSILLANGAADTWGVGNAAGETFATRIAISGADSTNQKTVVFDSTLVRPNGSVLWARGAGGNTATGRITGLVVSGTSGVFSSGKATVYALPSTDRIPDPIDAAVLSLWVGAVA